VIKVSRTGDVKTVLWARIQDEPYAPDLLPGEWCVISPQLGEKKKKIGKYLITYFAVFKLVLYGEIELI